MVFKDAFKAALKQKLDLMQTIKKQMADDVKNNVLKPETTKYFDLAATNFDAAAINMDNAENALHHYSRGCVNYGEFMARQKADRGK